MEIKTIRIGTYRPRGFGFKVCEKDDRLLVTHVSTDGAAFHSGLRRDDIIHAINGQSADISAINFASKMNGLSGEVTVTVLRQCVQPRRSYGDLSTASNQTSSSSLQNMVASQSAVDLTSGGDLGGRRRLLGDNYVPEAQIATYLQEGEESGASGITRKGAYRRPVAPVPSPEGPRIQVKKANKAASFYGREAAFVIKKRTNTGFPSNGLSRRPSAHPSPLSTSSPATSYGQLQTSDPSNLAPEDLTKLEPIRLEVHLKILSFKEKIRKPAWRRYVVERDTFGVLFTSQEAGEQPSPCNSTAIDPYVSGLQVFMDLWALNNTAARFLLPMGQAPFCAEIEVVCTPEAVQVRHQRLEVDLVVSLARLPEESASPLCALLGVPIEPRAATPQRRSQEEPPKANRTKKAPQETPRTALSGLPQTRLVEGVPLVVVLCVGIIERLGLRREGVYRMPGNEGLKRRLEAMVASEACERWSDCEAWANLNVVVSLLKSALRGFALIDRDTAIRLSMATPGSAGAEARVQAHMDMAYHLRQHLAAPRPGDGDRETRCRLETFKFLLKHLDRVARQQAHNRMGPDNLATCLYPTLIEDIPCHDDDPDYQGSKKADADKNLKQMVAFWIKNADLVCELLEEEDEQRRFDRVDFFCRQEEGGDGPPPAAAPEVPEDPEDEAEAAAVVRELVQYYVGGAFILPVALPAEDSPDMGASFQRMKALGAYRSYKLPRKAAAAPLGTGVVRRSSTSLSPQEERKVPTPAKNLSPHVQRKIDGWASRSFRSRKKGPETMLPPKMLDLTNLSLSGVTKNVPLAVDVCTSIVGQFGLEVDGVYRVSGRKQDIEVLETIVTSSAVISDLTQERLLPLWANVHLVACVLKAVLRRLCLIPRQTWVHMAAQFASKLGPTDLRRVLMAAAYHLRRPGAARGQGGVTEEGVRAATLRHVLRHLQAVARHTASNKMTAGSLAICFEPVLMEEDTSGDLVSLNHKGIQLLEKLIEHCEWIFQWDDEPSEAMYGLKMTDSLEEHLQKFEETEKLRRAPRTDDQTIAQHIVDTESVRKLLESLVHKSMISAMGRLSLRRHSDGTEVPPRSTHEFRGSRTLDDNHLSTDLPPIPVRRPQDSLL